MDKSVLHDDKSNIPLRIIPKDLKRIQSWFMSHWTYIFMLNAKVAGK
jgi:hypothetical protein